MKKLLTILFMAVVTASSFAAVSLQTTKPDINRNGTCERIGTMKFNVTTDGDFSVLTTASTAVILKVRLVTDLGRKDVPLTVSYGYDATGAFDWTLNNITVDGTIFTGGHIAAQCGAPYFFVRITDAEFAGFASPSNPGVFTVGDSALSPMSVNPKDLFQLNEYCVLAVSDYVATGTYVDVDPYTVDWEAEASDVTNTDVDFLGNSYQPADPTVAIARELTINTGVTLTKVCPKPLVDPVIYLCPCVDVAQESSSCYDLYREGDICNLVITEEYLGSLKLGDTITLTLPTGVYFPDYHGAPTVTANLTAGGVDASFGTFTDPTSVTGPYTVADGEVIASSWVSESCDPARNAVDSRSGDCAGTSSLGLYSSITLSVDAAATAVAGQITISGLYIARNTADAPLMDVPITLTAGKTDPSLCPDCAHTLTATLDDVADFVACDFSDELEIKKTQVYFPYFPDSNVYGTDYTWWSGVAVTNVNKAFGAPEQAMHVELTFIDAVGNVYDYDLGVIPANGLKAITLSSLTPTQVSGPTTAFGVNPYWVIATCEGTVPGLPIYADGFGMMGDYTQAQGNLGRTMSLMY